MGKWRTRKIGPVVSEGEEKPGLLGFPAPCFILCSTHLSTWLKHCVFSSNIAICGRWLNTYLIFLDLIVEVNHRKISVLCYLIYSVLSKCQFMFYSLYLSSLTLHISHLIKYIPVAPAFGFLTPVSCPPGGLNTALHAAQHTLSLVLWIVWLCLICTMSLLHASVVSGRACPHHRHSLPLTLFTSFRMYH